MFKYSSNCNIILRFLLNKPFFVYKNNWIVDYNFNLINSLYSSLEYTNILPIDIYTYNQLPVTKCINYIFYSYSSGSILKIRASLYDSISSSSSFFLVNSWYEREVTEFNNIKFLHSNDSRCLLLPYSYINSSFTNYSVCKDSYSLKYTLVSRCIKPIYRYSTIL